MPFFTTLILLASQDMNALLRTVRIFNTLYSTSITVIENNLLLLQLFCLFYPVVSLLFRYMISEKPQSHTLMAGKLKWSLGWCTVRLGYQLSDDLCPEKLKLGVSIGRLSIKLNIKCKNKISIQPKFSLSVGQAKSSISFKKRKPNWPSCVITDLIMRSIKKEIRARRSCLI